MNTARFGRAALAVALAGTILTREAPKPGDEDERRQPMAGFQGRRLLGTFQASSYNADAHTVEAVLSSGSAVKRYYFTEELEISPEAVDLGRAASGQVKLLDSHNQYEADAVVGTVSNVRVDGSQLLGTLKFGETDNAKKIEGMVVRGELTGVSIGYRVNTWEIQTTIGDGAGDVETWRATRWELLEVSLVSVPADANAGVRSLSGSPSPSTGETAATEEEDQMKRNNPGGAPAAVSPVAPAVEPVRAAEPAPAPAAAESAAPAAPAISRFGAGEALAFVEQARSFGDTVATRANELIAQNERDEISVETARSTLLQAAAEAQRAQTAPARSGAVTITRDEMDTTRGLVADAIVARALRQDVPEASRQFVGMRLLEIAASRANLSRGERNPDTILRAAMTGSDFPLLLEAAANKMLLARYNTATPTYQSIAARRDLNDFKATKLLRVGDFPTLLPYQEDGEIKAGTINEGRETVILGSYGRNVRLSRQAIVNDDLGAFDSVFASIGLVVARFENATFFAMKAANSGAGPNLSDGNPLFHAASHKNVAASGAAPDVTTLGAGRAAMRKQKDLDGNPLNVPPSIILVGPDIETVTQQLLAPIQAQQVGNVNPFAGKLSIEVDANIVGNAWELYGDPAMLPAFNYGYLADAPGPKVMTKEGFDHDGIAFRVTEDFYAGAVDYRAAYRNPGA